MFLYMAGKPKEEKPLSSKEREEAMLIQHNYDKMKEKEKVERLKEEIRWRIKAMNRGEYTPQQTSLNIRRKIDEIFGEFK